MHILGSGSTKTQNTHTGSKTADHNLHCVGAHVRSCHSKQGRVTPGLLPEKQELVCSINACMTRPIPRPTCQRRECLAALEMLNRLGTGRLKNYSGIHRPRGLGRLKASACFHRQGNITNHGIPFLFQFCLWDANMIKLH